MKISDQVGAVMHTNQETAMQITHGDTDWFNTEKEVKGCILSLSLFNLYTEEIPRKMEFKESKIGVKIGVKEHQKSFFNLLLDFYATYPTNTTLQSIGNKTLLLETKKDL